MFRGGGEGGRMGGGLFFGRSVMGKGGVPPFIVGLCLSFTDGIDI